MVPTTAVPATDEDHEEPPFAPALIEELLRQLDKTVRARQLYMANNPSYTNAVEKLRACFVPVWAETDAFTLTVTDTQFRWSGVAVHEQPEKASDSLPWLFYKDGLREVTLSNGFERDELNQLIEIIPKVRRAQADEDDLITILWEHEFAFLSYRHVDVGQEGSGVPMAGVEPGRYPVESGVGVESPGDASDDARAEAEANPETLKERPGVVKLEDFDSTLYFLDEKEIDYIKREVEKEYAADLRHTVLQALLDILELQTDVRVRTEALQLLDQMVLHLLAAGRFQSVAHLIRESQIVIERARELDPAHRDRLKSLPNRISEPATLAQILQTIDESATMPSQADLNALFGELQASALETVFEWLGRIQNAHLRALLETSADRLASANTGELVRLITQAQGVAAVEAVRRAGALRTAAAVAPLAKVLGEQFRELRNAAVAALVEIGSPGALQMLERALSDTDRDIRMTAVRALGSRGARGALPRIDAMVKSKDIRAVDLTERMAFFEAYGQLCGDGGIAFLDGLLNGKSGLLGRRGDPEIRACAAMALGHVKSPRATDALQKAMSEKDVIVRNAVNRALRGGAL
jgi:HEAT repeat protein